MPDVKILLVLCLHLGELDLDLHEFGFDGLSLGFHEFDYPDDHFIHDLVEFGYSFPDDILDVDHNSVALELLLIARDSVPEDLIEFGHGLDFVQMCDVILPDAIGAQ